MRICRVVVPDLPTAVVGVDPEPVVCWPKYEVFRLVPGKVYLDQIVYWHYEQVR